MDAKLARGGEIEAAFLDYVNGQDLPEHVRTALEQAFFTGAYTAFYAVNDINACADTTVVQKQAALAALYDEIDQFLRGRPSPSGTRQ